MSTDLEFERRRRESQLSKIVRDTMLQVRRLSCMSQCLWLVDGTWLDFLYQDGNMTRKAFSHWYIHIYLKTDENKKVPKAAKAEVQHLLNARPPYLEDRDALLPATVRVMGI